MIPYKHTKEELLNLSDKTDKHNTLKRIATNYNDEFLKIYVNLLKSEIQLELNKYNYLIGEEITTMLSESGKITNIHCFYRDTVLVFIEIENSNHIQIKALENLALID